MEKLLGRVSEIDVEDCGELTLMALKKFKHVVDPSKVGVMGLSHGGFLTAWLAGHPAYKDLWKAACM